MGRSFLELLRPLLQGLHLLSYSVPPFIADKIAIIIKNALLCKPFDLDGRLVQKVNVQPDSSLS